MMIIAVVIPAVFNSFGMEPAGRFLRRVFDGYGQMTLAILLFLLGMSGVRYWQSLRLPAILFPITRLEIILLAAMTVVTILILWVLGPQAISLQEQAFESTTDLEKKTAYDQFFRLHMIVRALHLTNLGLAIGLFIGKLRKGIILQS